MVKACDAIAKEFAGRMEATVDFEFYEAQIILKCAYVEFCHGEFMEILQKLTTSAIQIQISPISSSPFLKIEIRMPYFTILTGNISS